VVHVFWTMSSLLSCPYRLADLVGFGVAIASRKQYLQSYPERCYKSMLIQIMLEENRTGFSY
jgi:enoyl-CoA hydratase/3-hydroxyacyl-CoA dehydrogenase